MLWLLRGRAVESVHADSKRVWHMVEWLVLAVLQHTHLVQHCLQQFSTSVLIQLQHVTQLWHLQDKAGMQLSRWWYPAPGCTVCKVEAARWQHPETACCSHCLLLPPFCCCCCSGEAHQLGPGVIVEGELHVGGLHLAGPHLLPLACIWALQSDKYKRPAHTQPC